MEPVYGTIIQVARLTWKMQGLKFTVTGLENLPDSGGGVVAINHTSYFDFTFAGLPAYEQGLDWITELATGGEPRSTCP